MVQVRTAVQEQWHIVRQDCGLSQVYESDGMKIPYAPIVERLEPPPGEGSDQ